MSRHLHLDPLGGAAGDMFLGLLHALGVPAETLASVPRRLGLHGVEVACSRVTRGGLDAGRVHVRIRGWEEPPAEPDHDHRHDHDHHHDHDHEHHHDHVHAHDRDHDRNHDDDHGHDPAHDHDHDHDHAPTRDLAAALAIVAAADLPARAKALATRALERLYAAEASVHGVPLDQVHLHEAGADDALVDICCTALGLVVLDVTSVTCSTPVPVGSGTIRCAHGRLPVPGPAVAELLRGVPVTAGPVARELVTPTGAALLRAVVDEFRPLPALALDRAGHGAGGRDHARVANVLRGLYGTRQDAPDGPRERHVAVLETALDDVLPQDVPVLIERLLAAGARDAHVTPVLMKKGRPGFVLTAICDPDDAAALAGRILRDGPALGVRIRQDRRLEWDRDTVPVETPWGPVRIKRALDGRGRVVRGQPEFEDCRALADAADVPVDEVRRAALAAGNEGGKKEGAKDS